LERLKMLKSPPQGQVKRHQSIADTMVFHCRDLGVTPRGLSGNACPRLAELLSQPHPEGGGFAAVQQKEKTNVR
jgi:hypothetical protein